MKNLDKLYKYLEEDKLTEKFIEYLKKNNVRVNTIVAKKWSGKPYICFNTYCKEWFLFLSNKDTRRIKKLMKLAKKRIRLEVPKARVNFCVRNYNYYVEEAA